MDLRRAAPVDEADAGAADAPEARAEVDEVEVELEFEASEAEADEAMVEVEEAEARGVLDDEVKLVLVELVALLPDSAPATVLALPTRTPVPLGSVRSTRAVRAKRCGAVRTPLNVVGLLRGGHGAAVRTGNLGLVYHPGAKVQNQDTYGEPGRPCRSGHVASAGAVVSGTAHGGGRGWHV